MDMPLWCVLALLSLVAVWSWGEEFHESFVHPANTVPGAPPGHPYSNQDG